MLRRSDGDLDPIDAGTDRIVERFYQLAKKRAPRSRKPKSFKDTT